MEYLRVLLVLYFISMHTDIVGYVNITMSLNMLTCMHCFMVSFRTHTLTFSLYSMYVCVYYRKTSDLAKKHRAPTPYIRIRKYTEKNS